jgi:hypothetical protein
MPQQFSVRLDDDTSAAFEEEAARRNLSLAEALRTAVMAFLDGQESTTADNHLLIEVLRTRALLARYIVEQTDEETFERLKKESRLDVEAQLKDEA